MAYTTEVNSAKSLEEIIRKYEESTQSHFILKYSDKNFFDESMCLCVTSWQMVKCGMRLCQRVTEMRGKSADIAV